MDLQQQERRPRAIPHAKKGERLCIPVFTQHGAKLVGGDICWSHQIILLLRREFDLHDVGLGRDNSRDQWPPGKTILRCTPERCSVGIGRPGDDAQPITKTILGMWQSAFWPQELPMKLTSTRLNRYSLPEKPPTIMRASRGSCIRFICSSISIRTYT